MTESEGIEYPENEDYSPSVVVPPPDRKRFHQRLGKGIKHHGGRALKGVGKHGRKAIQGVGDGFRNLKDSFGSSGDSIARFFIFGAIILAAILGIFLLLPGTLAGKLMPYLIGILICFLIIKYSENQFLKLLFIVLMIGIILLATSNVLIGENSLFTGEGYNKIISKISIKFAEFIESLRDFTPKADANGFIDRQIAVASGGYFEGQVEESKEDQRLGIYIDKIESSDPVIFEGEEVTIWATLTGKTMEEQVNVNLDCKTDKGKKVSSSKEITIYSFEQEYLDCKINNVPKGAFKVTFTADYNFKTLGYSKAYFIDSEKLRSLRRQNIDPLTEYGISDRNPIAIYTNGPVKIGIGTTDYQPISVKNDNTRLSRLGITLENRWQGKIKTINELEIQVPSSMSVKNCDHQMEEVKGVSNLCKEKCKGIDECEQDCSGYNFFRLTESSKKKLKDIEDYQTIYCYIHHNNDGTLLGQAPITTQYIRVTANYDYRAEEYKMFYGKTSEIK